MRGNAKILVLFSGLQYMCEDLRGTELSHSQVKHVASTMPIHGCRVDAVLVAKSGTAYG